MNVSRFMRAEIAKDVKRAEHLGLMAKQKEAKEKKCQKNQSQAA